MGSRSRNQRTIPAAGQAAMPIGMIGLGVVSTYYLAALEGSRDLVLRSVCDVEPRKAAALVTRGVGFTADHDELLARDDVQAVVVNLPNALHYDVCRSALSAGKDVCCEKPLSLTSAEAGDLAAAAEREGRILFTAFHRRYNSNVLRLAKEAGDVLAAHVDYFERIEEHCGTDSWYLDPTMAGGGCVADNGPNAFDTLTLLLGRLEVEAATVERDEKGIDVRAVVHLRSERGVPATACLSWAYEHGEKKDVTVLERDGTMRYADMLAHYPGFKQSLYHEYRAVLEHFTTALRRRSHEDTGPDMVRLVEDAYRLGADVRSVVAPPPLA